MEVQEFERLFEQPGSKSVRIPKELKRPYPRHGPKGDFQTARPVYPHSRRILLHPRCQVPDKYPRKPLVAGKPKCKPECEKMLVSIQLPQDLAIADFRSVNVVELLPVLHRR